LVQSTDPIRANYEMGQGPPQTQAARDQRYRPVIDPAMRSVLLFLQVQSLQSF
jgi:hypothetical protein